MQAASLDLFAPGSAGLLALFGARVGGLVLVAPVFSARTVPATVRTGLLVLLTVLLAPVARGAAGGVPALTPAAFLTETLIGFAIGLGAALLVGAAEAAGELMAIQIGLSGASLMDPVNQQSTPVLGQFMQLFALALLLALDLHLVMLDALVTSVRLVPVGTAVDVQAGMGEMVRVGGTLFVLGLRFAAPVIAAVLVANVALAVLSRAAPQLNVLSVAFPLQIGIGLFALLAALPFIATWFGGWTQGYDALVQRMLEAMR